MLLDIERARRKVNKLSRDIPAGAPWLAKKAAEYDATTLAAFIEKITWTRKARELLEIAVDSPTGTALRRAVAAWNALLRQRGGNSATPIDTEGGAQQDRLVGGSQELSLRMAEELGDAVALFGARTGSG